MKKNKVGRPPALVTAQRKQKAVELAKQGQSNVEIARELGVHPVSIGDTLRQLRESMSMATQEEYEVYRKGQLSILELIEAELVEGKLAPDIAAQWRGVRSDIAKLLGLNAPERSVAMRVNAQDPAKLGLYQRFLRETRWIDERDWDQLWMFCQRMSNPPKAAAQLVEWEEEPSPIEGGDDL